MFDIIRMIFILEGMTLFFLVIFYFVWSYAHVMLFKRVFPDVEAWKGFVPFLNQYIICEKIFGRGWYCFLFLIPYVGYVAPLIIGYQTAKQLNQGIEIRVLNALIPFVMYYVIASKPETRYLGTTRLFDFGDGQGNQGSF